MFSENLEQSLNQANQLARELKCQFITLEHLLLALLDNPEARDVLLTLGVDIDAIRVNLRTYIEKNSQKQDVFLSYNLSTMMRSSVPSSELFFIPKLLGVLKLLVLMCLLVL